MTETSQTVARSIEDTIGKFEDVRQVLDRICRRLSEEAAGPATIATLRCAMIAHEEAIQDLEELIDCQGVRPKLKLAVG